MMISIPREKLWLTPLMKPRSPAQFLALPLATILKFKTLSLDTMKLCYWTTAYRTGLLLHPVAALVPTYPWLWYLPCHVHLQHPLWTPSQHLPWLVVFTHPMQHNAHQLRNPTGTQMTKWHHMHLSHRVML